MTHFRVPGDRIRVEAARRPQGGSAFHRADYRDHARRLARSVNQLRDRIPTKADANLAEALFVQVRTAEGRSVKAERSHLDTLGLKVVRLSQQSDTLAVARVSKNDLLQLEQRIQQYASPGHTGRTYLSALEEVSEVPLEEKIVGALLNLPDEEEADCIVSLYSYLPKAEAHAIGEAIRTRFTRRVDALPHMHDFLNGTTAIAGVVTGKEMRELGSSFSTVASIELNGQVLDESGVLADPLPNDVRPGPPVCPLPVAVIDSGISDACPFISDLVVHRVVELPPNSVGPHLEHGTFVASRVVYADDVALLSAAPVRPTCPVIDVQVTGCNAIGERIPPLYDSLQTIIERIVPALRTRTPVFNLSLGCPRATADYISPLAKSIDYLSREYKVLFVVSAGNIDRPSAAPSAHYAADDTMVFAPAESLLAITVGAIAKRDDTMCCVRPQYVAPYSRRGPGIDGGVKPDLVANGGNVVFNNLSFRSVPTASVYGIAGHGQNLSYAHGTSYSAPLVAQHAARLFHAIPGASPNLVKALLLHFTDEVHTPALPSSVEPVHITGFGEANIQSALSSPSSSAVYIYEGEIQPDTYLYMPFYIPKALAAASGRGRLVVRGTVVFDPPVDPDNRVEYSKARMTFQLRKKLAVGFREVAVGSGEDDSRLAWNPVLQFAKRFSRGFSAGEWELRLRLFTRGGLPADFKQTFAIVLEIQDSTGGINLADHILSEMPGIYAPLVIPIAA